MPTIASGIRGQTQLDDFLDFSGTITSGGTAQLLLPQQPRRLSLFIFNGSGETLYLGVGPAKATATISGGGVSAIAVNNGGTGYTVAPNVRILGGIIAGDYQTAPSHNAKAHATIAGGSVTTITMDDPGAGYLVAPLVWLENPLPKLGGGAFLPASGGSPAGLALTTGNAFSMSGSFLVPSSAIAIVGATTGSAFLCQVGGLV